MCILIHVTVFIDSLCCVIVVVAVACDCFVGSCLLCCLFASRECFLFSSLSWKGDLNLNETAGLCKDKNNNKGAPGGSVGGAGAPYTEALSSLQRTQV